jgi:hypothetical protein
MRQQFSSSIFTASTLGVFMGQLSISNRSAMDREAIVRFNAALV